MSDLIGAALCVGFAVGLVVGYLLGAFDRETETLDEHADQALSLFADAEQYHVDLWDAEIKAAR